MTDFTLYPSYDRNRFIRHIDGFVKPHLGTTSASDRCELAPIPAEWTEEEAPEGVAAVNEPTASAKKTWSMGPLIASFRGITADAESTK